MGKVPPATEYFGFALHVGATAALCVYLFWAFAPAFVLHSLHIYYYPSRWWAASVPAFILCLMLYTYIGVAAYNAEVLTPPRNYPETLSDLKSEVVGDFSLISEALDAVCDVPRATVSEILYWNDNS